MLSHLILWRYYLSNDRPIAQSFVAGHSGVEVVAFKKRMTLLGRLCQRFRLTRPTSNETLSDQPAEISQASADYVERVGDGR